MCYVVTISKGVEEKMSNQSTYILEDFYNPFRKGIDNKS
jgi:hypothetical protein